MKILIKFGLLLTLLIGVNAQGQSYSYKVKYGVIQAGVAELVHQVEGGILNSYLVIESSPWLSNLWTLSDSILSEYVIDVGRLTNHTKAIHEGGYHRNYDVSFSDSNFASVNGKRKAVMTEGLKDIPSLLYDLSNTRFKDGDTLNFNLWDGRGQGVLNLVVEKVGKPTLLRPFVHTGWKLTPLNSTRKSRENEIRLSMLYSKSYPHTPLRIEINTKYGNVSMRLDEP